MIENTNSIGKFTKSRAYVSYADIQDRRSKDCPDDYKAGPITKYTIDLEHYHRTGELKREG